MIFNVQYVEYTQFLHNYTGESQSSWIIINHKIVSEI